MCAFDFPDQTDRFKCCDRSFTALVVGIIAGTKNRLFVSVGREDTERDWHSGFETRLLDTDRCSETDELEMGRVTLDHTSKTDDPVDGPAPCKRFGKKRKLECSRRSKLFPIPDTPLTQDITCSASQPTGHLYIPQIVTEPIALGLKVTAILGSHSRIELNAFIYPDTELG
jgi:hypothetical protein